jgi:hypothetical protein
VVSSVLDTAIDLIFCISLLAAYAAGAIGALVIGRFLLDAAHEAITGSPLPINKERRSGTGRHGA